MVGIATRTEARAPGPLSWPATGSHPPVECDPRSANLAFASAVVAEHAESSDPPPPPLSRGGRAGVPDAQASWLFPEVKYAENGAGRLAADAGFRDPAFMGNRSEPVHRWVLWIAGYSRDFVDDALSRHAKAPGVVLDPFAGVGTTLVEADLGGHEVVGYEINPYAAFVSRTKLGAHRRDPAAVWEVIERFRAFMRGAGERLYEAVVELRRV